MEYTPVYETGNGGSIPSSGANYGCLAQLVEHHVDTVKVIGSNPVTSTKFRDTHSKFYPNDR